jgi:hypothetical protein
MVSVVMNMPLVQVVVIMAYVIKIQGIVPGDAQVQRYTVLIVIYHVTKIVREGNATEILDIVIKDVR